MDFEAQTVPEGVRHGNAVPRKMFIDYSSEGSRGFARFAECEGELIGFPDQGKIAALFGGKLPRGKGEGHVSGIAASEDAEVKDGEPRRRKGAGPVIGKSMDAEAPRRACGDRGKARPLGPEISAFPFYKKRDVPFRF